MASERELIEYIEAQATRLADAVAEAKMFQDIHLEEMQHNHQLRVVEIDAMYKVALARAKADYLTAEEQINRQQQEIESRYSTALVTAESAYEEKWTKFVQKIDSFVQAAGPKAIKWNDNYWNSWEPVTERRFPQFIRIGEVQAIGQRRHLTLPALISPTTGRNIFFKSRGDPKKKAVQVIQSLLLRLLTSVSPGDLRLVLIDPVGLGQNVAPFMHLEDYDATLITAKVWTESHHIEQRLADLTEHMQYVIQKYLRNQFLSIEEYNEQAGEIAEPFRILVALDFPVNFSEEAARRLISISQNGPRCGVHSIVLADTTKPSPYGFDLSDLERVATVIEWNGERYTWHDKDFESWPLNLDEPPPAGIFNSLLDRIGNEAKEANKVEVPFEQITEREEHWWKGESSQGIRAPLGPIGAYKTQPLELGDGTAQHVLIAGKTGSGKSTLLHVLITNLALIYSPEELELYLIDFKKGVEFKAYAVHQLPHARVIAIESEREFGLSVLQRLDDELKYRGDLFRAINVDHIRDYREKSGRPLPRILLLVDEFQEFFTEDDAIASHASQILDRLVRQGRAFGVHILLGSQTLAGSYALARSTIDQMAVRIALQCSEADSRLILADDNPGARLLSRPGEAIYNNANGLVEGNNLFQVAWLSDDLRDQYLARIQVLAEQHNYHSDGFQVVFEGNAPAEVDKNALLNSFLTTNDRSEPLHRFAAWLGDPIAIKEATAAYFRRQSGSNLLIIGKNDEEALGMLVTALVSLMAQHAPAAKQESPASLAALFYVLDFSPVDASYANTFSCLAQATPHSLKIGGRRHLPSVINTVANEVLQRISNDDNSLPIKSDIYLIIYGLQRARDLRFDEDFGFSSRLDEGPEAPNPSRQFATILRDGPEVGVHSLVWCDTYANLGRTLDRRSIREFEMRVAFQMSSEDSSNLVDTPAASKLGPYRAFFYGEEDGRLEKFRPYGLPSQQWLDWARDRLQPKWSTRNEE